ncbi:MAG: hypothetical protein KME47_25720 [Nodosilinea sp. WJT8-NPBG4]|jgi:hypothetical protein|nr:hypothetical protein [Nodosilinea sp. WJT8-NPBG4]
MCSTNERVDRIIASIANSIPIDTELSHYIINTIGLRLHCSPGINTDFVREIFEPWCYDQRIYNRSLYESPLNESWSVYLWTNSRLVNQHKHSVALLSGATTSVQRWRGDDQHLRLSGSSGALLVLHEKPFEGITVYLPDKKTIYSVFDNDPNISHCEHVLKYPSRTQSRLYDIWDCHASAVLHNDEAVIFVGNRRSGKTTCVIEMIARESYYYIANDLCAIDLTALEGIYLHAIPHMLRLTDDNISKWPDIAHRALKVDRDNEDYTKGFVFCGGKYEIYAPVARDFIGEIVGSIPYPVKFVIFPHGSLEPSAPVIRELSSDETTRRLAQQLCSDRPLPDWLAVESYDTHRPKRLLLELCAKRPLHGLDFQFHFSDSSAFDKLTSVLGYLDA